MIDVLKNLINNLGLVILIAFLLSKLSLFKKLMQKNRFDYQELVILSFIFGGFSVIGTYIGTEFQGGIANISLIGVMSGGILAGPLVGMMTGLIAGIYRLTIGYGNITALPCAIALVTAGFASSIIYNRVTPKNKWLYGLIGGIVLQIFEAALILLMTNPFSMALEVVKNIYIPMTLTNSVGICMLILIIQNLFDEKEEIAAKQAKLSLEIANKTLPYFRDLSGDSLEKICEIIKDSIGADAVAITDQEFILAHVGLGSDHHVKGRYLLTEATGNVLTTGKVLSLNRKSEIKCINEECPLKSAIVAPLSEGEEVIGTLKIYYSRENAISYSTVQLALGLSHIISTQMEISKIGKLKELADKAEIRFLQAQINPHFLFNALNTIVSFLRFNPNRARELIMDLSRYLRYNIESGDRLVDIYKELEQVKAYIDIEKARFGEKLNVIYDIDENIDIKIPSLTIQPIVENSVIHGILEGRGSGHVKISIHKVNTNALEISIEDDGIGIPEEIIKKIYLNQYGENKIGISNVHNRLIYIYGKGLRIERLDRGTRTTFTAHALSS